MTASQKQLYSPAADMQITLKGRCSMLNSIVRISMAVLATATLFLTWTTAHAVGTAAGTNISNSATATYSVNGVAAPPVVSSITLRVDELISVRVTAPATSTPVNTPDTNKVLVFTVTNVGNGAESFNLTPNLSPAAPPDQFNPTPGSAGQLFIDSNNNGLFDSGTDQLIPPGAPTVTLNADQVMRILFVSNIPGALVNGNQGAVTLTAASTTPGAAGAAPGTILANLGTPTSGGGTVDAVVGVGPGGAADSGSDDVATGIYVVATVTVTLNKVVLAVTSPFGVTTTGCNVASPPAACNAIVPGTIVQYQVTVTITGDGTAQNVQVTDNIPANTTYVAQSIRFNFPTAPPGTRTDQVDADNASCTGCGNATGAVTVVIGDVAVTTGNPVNHVIDYRVSIN